jgi:hypothetical protein
MKRGGAGHASNIARPVELPKERKPSGAAADGTGKSNADFRKMFAASAAREQADEAGAKPN